MNSFHAGQDYEREKMKREIHDGLAQELFGLQMLTAQLLAQDQPNVSTPIVERINTQLNRAVCCVKGFIAGQIPQNLENKEVLEAVQECFSFDESRTVLIVGTTDLIIEKNNIGYDLFRITQEFVSNALRHADAQRIIAWFQARDNGLSVLLEDDGIGFDLSQNRAGKGLNNMVYRLENIDAEYDFYSAKGNGTSLKIDITYEND